MFRKIPSLFISLLAIYGNYGCLDIIELFSLFELPRKYTGLEYMFIPQLFHSENTASFCQNVYGYLGPTFFFNFSL